MKNVVSKYLIAIFKVLLIEYMCIL